MGGAGSDPLGGVDGGCYAGGGPRGTCNAAAGSGGSGGDGTDRGGDNHFEATCSLPRSPVRWAGVRGGSSISWFQTVPTCQRLRAVVMAGCVDLRNGRAFGEGSSISWVQTVLTQRRLCVDGAAMETEAFLRLPTSGGGTWSAPTSSLALTSALCSNRETVNGLFLEAICGFRGPEQEPKIVDFAGSGDDFGAWAAQSRSGGGGVAHSVIHWNCGSFEPHRGLGSVCSSVGLVPAADAYSDAARSAAGSVHCGAGSDSSSSGAGSGSSKGCCGPGGTPVSTRLTQGLEASASCSGSSSSSSSKGENFLGPRRALAVLRNQRLSGMGGGPAGSTAAIARCAMSE